MGRAEGMAAQKTEVSASRALVTRSQSPNLELTSNNNSIQVIRLDEHHAQCIP